MILLGQGGDGNCALLYNSGYVAGRFGETGQVRKTTDVLSAPCHFYPWDSDSRGMAESVRLSRERITDEG